MRLPSSRDIVLIDRVAIQSTLVVLALPSVLVIVSHVSFHGVGEDDPQVMPDGKASQAVDVVSGRVTEHTHPSGHVVPVGVVMPQR